MRVNDDETFLFGVNYPINFVLQKYYCTEKQLCYTFLPLEGAAKTNSTDDVSSNMAAPMREHNKHTNMDLSDLKLADSSKSDSPSEDGDLTDDIVVLVQKEIGGDLKSLKKVSGLLEKLTLENKQLEEQVNNTNIRSVQIIY